MLEERKVKVHFKSNHADPKSFPPTIEGESVSPLRKQDLTKLLKITPT